MAGKAAPLAADGGKEHTNFNAMWVDSEYKSMET
jgi:hypothetical protein